MSVVVALNTGKSVYLAADSAGFDPDSFELMLRKDEKIFWLGKFLIGSVGSFRESQVLRFHCDAITELEPKGDGFEFIIKEFIPIVRQAMSDYGVTRVVDNQEFSDPFIVAWDSQFYVIDGDLHVANPAYNFYAIGCASLPAMGSLWNSTNYQDLRTHEDICEAMASACGAAHAFSVGVRPPFTVISTEGMYKQFY